MKSNLLAHLKNVDILVPENLCENVRKAITENIEVPREHCEQVSVGTQKNREEEYSS